MPMGATGSRECAGRRYWISGHVQGVGFRYFVERRARALGVRGWVQNLPDGRVEVLACGFPDALGALEAALEAGPRGARVDRVETAPLPEGVSTTPGTFEIRRS